MARSGDAVQLSFPDPDDASEVPLAETTFVVVDLETTGSRTVGADGAEPDAITEIGAIKVRGGTVLGEFATLVNPQRPIPPQITGLTGITAAMVRSAPTIDVALPMFLEFAGFRGSDRHTVLVAHNAAFDAGFLAAAARRCGIDWPHPPVLCTVRLARRVLSRDEAPSVRLAALAGLFCASSTPTHRALDDTRATVDVLHALIDRVGNSGVRTLAELRSYTSTVTTAQRRKRVFADGLPHRPGVYLFRGPSDEVLYVGTATDLRRRVGQYFNGADRRSRITELVALAERVDHVECAHPLEAGVRELRLLTAHAPPYNRRSKFPQRRWWIALTEEPFPRLAVLRAPRHDSVIGPFPARADAVDVAALLARLTGLRSCTARLARTAEHRCAGRDVAPCPAVPGITAESYAVAVAAAAALIDGVDNRVLAEAVRRVGDLAERGRYESAARLRDQTATAIEALWRSQRSRALVALPELVAAAPDGAGGCQLAIVRHGQLAAAGCAARGVPPLPVVAALRAGAQVITAGPDRGPRNSAAVEETALIMRWLAAPGVRIVHAEHPGWRSPRHSAGQFLRWAAAARSARLAADQLAEQRSELLAEPHPTRQQLLGGPAVDRGNRPLQPVLPRRQPFGAAG